MRGNASIIPLSQDHLKKMKKFIYLFLLPITAIFAACSDNDNKLGFNTDQSLIEIGANGGSQMIQVNSPGEWIASCDVPWIMVSPANGRGSTVCEVFVDSALTTSSRVGTIRIQDIQTLESQKIDVKQDGYDYMVELAKQNITIPNFATLENRKFDVEVLTNTPFEVVIPDNASWLSVSTPEFVFDRQARPRKFKLTFEWKISSQPERTAEITFEPKNYASKVDRLFVTQGAAPEIPAGTHEGDSIAVVGTARALGTWESWDRPDPMSQWSDVVLWEEGMEGWTPEKDGRIKKATFTFFETKEGLPYEVQYLTAAEELVFTGNVNSFLLDLDPGEYIAELTQLKKLTMMGYGLNYLTESFTKLKNLEYLDLSANNFMKLPDILSQDNFPNLKQLILNANQRKLVYDLSNDLRTGLGGFYESTTPEGSAIPRKLLEWDNLESLVLGVNYLQGQIPDLAQDPTWTKFYTEADVAVADSLPSGKFEIRDINGKPEGVVGMPKVWPNMKHLTINYNRITGTAPDWLLYHPALDWWVPFTFIFNQEGKDELGRSAGFDNEPPSTLDYYYNFYTTKSNPYGN